MEKLFKNDRQLEDVEQNSGPKITEEKVRYDIQNAKSGKSSGPDEISVDLLKVIVDKGNIKILKSKLSAVAVC